MKAYSVDLRTKIMTVVNENTMQLQEISALFQINVKTIFRWRKQFKATGSFEAKKVVSKGKKGKITDLEYFKAFVENNSDLTLKEMAKKWGNISTGTIWRALKKINFTFKKNSFYTQKVIKKKEKNF